MYQMRLLINTLIGNIIQFTIVGGGCEQFYTDSAVSLG